MNKNTPFHDFYVKRRKPEAVIPQVKEAMENFLEQIDKPVDVNNEQIDVDAKRVVIDAINLASTQAVGHVAASYDVAVISTQAGVSIMPQNLETLMAMLGVFEVDQDCVIDDDQYATVDGVFRLYRDIYGNVFGTSFKPSEDE